MPAFPSESILITTLYLHTQITGSTGGTNATTAFKKAEELIVSRLWMVEKALRGAAEILGDALSEPGERVCLCLLDYCCAFCEACLTF